MPQRSPTLRSRNSHNKIVVVTFIFLYNSVAITLVGNTFYCKSSILVINVKRYHFKKRNEKYIIMKVSLRTLFGILQAKFCWFYYSKIC